MKIDTTLTSFESQMLDRALNWMAGNEWIDVMDDSDNDVELQGDEFLQLWSSLYKKIHGLP